MTDQTYPLRIDFVSDVVCPWCAIGYHQLKIALTTTGIKTHIHWHPFELNPDMPLKGKNAIEYGAQKYGSTLEETHQKFERITAAGKAANFDFRLSDEIRIWNTFSVHQLIHWADEFGLAHPLKISLFSAHFTDNRNLSDIQTLAELAQQAGLDRDEAIKVLEEQRYAADVRGQENHWLQQGISGVPAIIFDNKHLVTGAQGTENYVRILRQLTNVKADAS